mgnify:CR=1 FL=1
MAGKKLEGKFESKVMCKACEQDTWHTVLHCANTGWDDEDSGMWERTTSFTLQCLGCDNVCLLIQSQFSEDIDSRTGIPELNKSVHPSPYKSDREEVARLFSVPKGVKSVYEETIKAFNGGMMILTAMGIRATIEAIAIEQKITVRGIKKKILKMENLKIITPEGVKLLELVTDIGNLAAHEIKKHHRDDIALCIDIVEDVLRSLYILPEEARHTREVIDGKWKRVD